MIILPLCVSNTPHSELRIVMKNNTTKKNVTSFGGDMYLKN
jgi:hypothetical protein